MYWPYKLRISPSDSLSTRLTSTLYRKHFKMKFIFLAPEHHSEIDALMRSKDCDLRIFKRLQSVKLNAQGYSIPQISEVLEVHYNSVYRWITAYEKEGVSGLKDDPISGRPPILTAADKQRVEAFIRATPQQPKVVLARVEEELGKSISRDTLKRTLKSLDHTYRRVKKSLRSKRDEDQLAAKKKHWKP